jgi:hypothetical protein
MARRVTRKPRQTPSSRTPVPVQAAHAEWTPGRRTVITGGIIALVLFFAIYLLRLDQVVGLYQDDAWYTVLAKALATGRGYTLISAPAPDIGAWIYPPGYPWLLSLAYRSWPEFPQNVPLLKSVSIAAMFVAAVAGYLYFTRIRETPSYVAAGIVLTTVLSPAIVFLATSTMMSECVFTMAQLLTILIIERAVRQGEGRRWWMYLTIGALVMSFTIMTRVIGFALAIGTFLYLVKERRIRGAIVLTVIVAAVTGPWAAYAWLHSPTGEQRRQQESYIVGSLGDMFWQRQAGNPYSGQIGLADVPGRMWDNLKTIVEHDVGVMVLAPLPYWEKSGEITAEGVSSSPVSRILSILLSVLAAAGFLTAVLTRITASEFVCAVTLLVIVVFPWTPFRYMLPLLPFIAFYILLGVRSGRDLYRHRTGRGIPQRTWKAAGVVAGCLVALNVYANAKYISRKYSPVDAERPEWVRIFEEHERLFAWIRGNMPLGKNAFITQNPPLLYLYTGQKTLPAADAALRRDVWKQHRVRYLVQMGVPRPPEPNEAEQRLDTLYRSNTAYNLRVVDFGERLLR